MILKFQTKLTYKYKLDKLAAQHKKKDFSPRRGLQCADMDLATPSGKAEWLAVSGQNVEGACLITLGWRSCMAA